MDAGIFFLILSLLILWAAVNKIRWRSVWRQLRSGSKYR